MTYKTALAGLPLGGGKSIIIGDSKSSNREALLRAHGRFVEILKGSYITAEDVGTSPADMEIMRLETQHVGGLVGGAGDPSPHTARGVFRAIQASTRFLWKTDDLSEMTVAIQGCGHVGYHLARLAHEAGAKLFVTDVDDNSVARVVDEFGAKFVRPADIFSTRANIFAPCALGGVINDATIPELNVQIVAGAANNQLLADRHGAMLRERNILYAPDYVANAGGVLRGCTELLSWDPDYAAGKIEEIYDTMLRIFESAEAQGLPTNEAADRLAEDRLRNAAPAQ
jgi:leucine dehydrogenase